LYRDAGEVHRAREQFELAKDTNPRYLRARVLLGALLLGAGSRDLAAAELKAVLEADPAEKTAQMYLRVLEQHARDQN
jgi:predicted Zn-dependent protease